MSTEENIAIPAEWFDPLEKNVLADLEPIMSKWADQIFGVMAIIIHKGKRRAGLVLAPAGLIADDWTPPKGDRCLGATAIFDPDEALDLWRELPGNEKLDPELPTMPVMYFAFGSPGSAVFLTRLARLDGQVEVVKDSAYAQSSERSC